MGTPISTHAVIQSAKKQLEGTRFLADVAIDDRVNWHVGYLVDCIFVEATAA
jgi:hypothetical protein